MTPEEIAEVCFALPGAWPDSPWEDHTVAKVHTKIFAFLGEEKVGLKLGGSREEADEWLRRHPADASVAAYVGRHGWTGLRLNGAIDATELREAVRESYDRVVAGLPRKHRPG